MVARMVCGFSGQPMLSKVSPGYYLDGCTLRYASLVSKWEGVYDTSSSNEVRI